LGPSDDIDQLLNRADQALYIGKSSGRDRVCSESELTGT
jgi:PleD family two-component response regulator